jgi:acyl-CoA dehydrogenase
MTENELGPTSHSILDDRWLDVAAAVARDVAGPAADSVDQESRFPAEAMTAIRSSGLLGIMVPAAMGGAGATLDEVANVVRILARECASTAMIYAMHQIEVACLIAYPTTPWLRELCGRVADGQLLLANAGSEVGVGGGGWSICAVVSDGDTFSLDKNASVVSYGAHADGIVVSARRSPDSQADDQVTVVCLAEDLTLEEIGPWNTIGLRGTCSNAFRIIAHGSVEQIMADKNAVLRTTYMPVANILRGAVWLGIAEAAAKRAHSVVRKQARKEIGQLPPAATRLANLFTSLEQMRDTLTASVEAYHRAAAAGTQESVGTLVRMDTVKLSTSALLIDIVSQALTICGINGYRQGAPESMSRVLRDAFAAPVMVSNDRVLKGNAHFLLGMAEI